MKFAKSKKKIDEYSFIIPSKEKSKVTAAFETFL